MTQEEELQVIEKHREILPLPFDEICKYSSFIQILGKNEEEYTEEGIKSRWEKHLSFLDKDMRNYWNNPESCIGCIHLDGSWCNYMSLPCTVNPLLTISGGMIGMACMGIGYDDGNHKKTGNSI